MVFFFGGQRGERVETDMVVDPRAKRPGDGCFQSFDSAGSLQAEASTSPALSAEPAQPEAFVKASCKPQVAAVAAALVSRAFSTGWLLVGSLVELRRKEMASIPNATS